MSGLVSDGTLRAMRHAVEFYGDDREPIPKVYQDLLRDLIDELESSRVKLAAVRAEVEPWADRILRDRILAILDGPTP